LTNEYLPLVKVKKPLYAEIKIA